MLNPSLRVFNLITLVGVLSSVAACSDDASTPSSTTDSGTPTADTASTADTSATDTNAAETSIIAPATDVTYDTGKGGPYFITGTVTLPASIAAGRSISAQYQKGSGFGVALVGNTVAGSTFTYKITGLDAGDYKIGFGVDGNGDGAVTDSGGDYSGFARGTVSAPKTATTADTITVSGPVTGVDFGLAVLP